MAAYARYQAAIPTSMGALIPETVTSWAEYFTLVLDGVLRNADMGLLYDPRRPAEVAFCRR